MDPEDKDYICTLDEYSLEKAKRELFEDPKQRLGAVQTLRAWIRSQPHFTCRVDTCFLLQILRTSKFSQLRAREIIENILVMRTKYPHLMVNIDSYEPGILSFIEKGVLLPLPKPDREGRGIMIMRPGCLNVDDPLMSVTNESRATIALQSLTSHAAEWTIVNGFILLFDLTGATTRLMTRVTPENARVHSKLFQDCNPGRMKAFLIYNAGAIFELFMAVVRPVMKKKYAERMRTFDTMESLYKAIPMDLLPEEYLPDYYKGPSAGPVQNIIDTLKQHFLNPEFRARLLDETNERYKVDERKRPAGVKQESFRKLNVD